MLFRRSARPTKLGHLRIGIARPTKLEHLRIGIGIGIVTINIICITSLPYPLVLCPTWLSRIAVAGRRIAPVRGVGLHISVASDRTGVFITSGQGATPRCRRES